MNFSNYRSLYDLQQKAKSILCNLRKTSKSLPSAINGHNLTKYETNNEVTDRFITFKKIQLTNKQKTPQKQQTKQQHPPTFWRVITAYSINKVKTFAFRNLEHG